MKLDPNGPLLRWFRELVAKKMSSIAIPVAGIAVSSTVMTFSKLFDYPIGDVLAWAGLTVLLFMLGLFSVAATVLVVRNLREPPKPPPGRDKGGRFTTGKTPDADHLPPPASATSPSPEPEKIPRDG